MRCCCSKGRRPRGEEQPQEAASQLRNVSVASEIDLRGMETIEGVLAAERYIDSAVMGKLKTVTIIHGKGNGRAPRRRAADAQEEQKRQILPLREIRRERSGRNCCRTEIKSVDASVKKCEKQRNGRKLLTIGLKFDKLSAQSCISIRRGKNYDNQRSSH